MPSYKVIQKGYFGGKLYDPEGKRKVLKVEKPFGKKDIPSWVEPIKDVKETAAEKKAREKSEKEQAEKDAQNKRDVDAAVSFQDKPSLSGPVETL